jgi:N-acylneuraminate cytidylyltransferase
MTVYGAVFARGGSKGVPRKNLRQIAGTSLLELSVAMGLASDRIDRMLCSTDSDEIATEAMRLGAEVPFRRPETLAQDDSPEWTAWQHLARFLVQEGASESDVLVSLPATSPLRAYEDIERALELFRKGTFDLVLGVSESTRSPWFNMVVREHSSEVSLVAGVEGEQIARRQDAPPVFDITTVVYVTTLGFAIQAAGLFEGNVGSVVIPRERAIDIDTEFDLEIADYLLRKRLGLGNG